IRNKHNGTIQFANTLIFFSLMLSCVERVTAQIKYSIPEEVKIGSVVGNVGKDLGLDISLLEERRFQKYNTWIY
uniref:Cadherin N-terminal domain-containing protein n=1 Tax=Pundamilia nyererei TaxID=303518 RepID=A0A3B4EVS9_9CICH